MRGGGGPGPQEGGAEGGGAGLGRRAGEVGIGGQRLEFPAGWGGGGGKSVRQDGCVSGEVVGVVGRPPTGLILSRQDHPHVPLMSGRARERPQVTPASLWEPRRLGQGTPNSGVTVISMSLMKTLLTC